jgi:hypothetical protein
VGKKKWSAMIAPAPVASKAGPSPPAQAAKNTAGNSVIKGNWSPRIGLKDMRRAVITATAPSAMAYPKRLLSGSIRYTGTGRFRRWKMRELPLARDGSNETK